MNKYRLMFRRQAEPNSEAFPLPVNPEKLPTQRQSANDTYNVLGLGQIMIPRIPELKKINISSFFPGALSGIEAFEPKNPEFYINFFENAMLNKEIISYVPVRVYEDGTQILLSMAEDIGMDCFVTSFEYEEKAGETGDFYFDLELTEYRDYTPVRVMTKEDAQTADSTVITAVAENTRNIPQDELYVGESVTVNGNNYYSSYGDEPHGTLNGQTCLISRIENTDPSRAYPVHVTDTNGGALGWIKRDACRVVSE